jgi:hypothetical protein
MQTPTDARNHLNASRDLTEHYKKILKSGEGTASGVEGVSDGGDGEPDLSEGGIRDRLDATQAELRRIVDEQLGGRRELHELAERITASASEALRALRDEDEEHLRKRPDLLDSLEAVVRTDGSRPSFMIRDGEVDKTSSPLGSWEGTLDASVGMLRDAVSCVGRIDIPSAEQGFEGTGFLIQDNLIATNRHVLQAVARLGGDGNWTFNEGVTIDFGHEFRARDSIGRRALRRVVFAGSKRILGGGPVDHTKLDLALVELEPTAPENLPRAPLALDVAGDWADPDITVYTLGYPANPGVEAYTPTLLEQLFQMTFGYKRLAPGKIMRPQESVHTWTMAHDATTLGGNSGSVILVVGREHAAAGLHYGGRRSEPRENWGFVLGRVLEETDGRSDVTLRQCLKGHGVQLIDRVGGRTPPVN